MKKTAVPLCLLTLVCVSVPAAHSQPESGDDDPKAADCSISAKKRYPIEQVVRDNGFRIPTRCDGPAKVAVMFKVSGPGKVVAFTPSYGKQHGDGHATFAAAGRKVVFVKLLKPVRRVLDDAPWAKGYIHVGVEIPGEPGTTLSLPEDTRHVRLHR